MKRLWKVIPPCLSDLLGFQMVLGETEGMGLIDDPSRYKPLRRDQAGRGSRGGRGGGRRDRGFRGQERSRRGSGGVTAGSRVVHSDIRNEDIITGTERKVMAAFEAGAGQLSPAFVLLAYGPSASMISSDLEYAAEQIQEQSGIPALSVKLDGEKDYLYGMGCTLEAMGKLLLTERRILPGTVNLLGANPVDWTEETAASVEALLTGAGWHILSRWGIKETTENLKDAAAAQVNVVVNESGLRLATYMQQEFGVPYVTGAPFGQAATEKLLAALERVRNGGGAVEQPEPPQGEPEALVVGEQFTANAIRLALADRGWKNTRVLSFCEMNRGEMLPGDKKLTGEDDFAAQANAPSVRLIIADRDYSPLVKQEVQWIGLPNGGSLSPVNPTENFNVAGGALDAWLDAERKGEIV
ncbi:MAG: nitrogenase component 1 [Clostridiales bacterium]|nr:nitrogenase component 1 [Clostridiales bacterium]